MLFEVVLYIILVIGFFTFLKVSKLEWGGKLIGLLGRILIALIVPAILVVTFVFARTVFTVLALIIVVIFVANFFQRRKLKKK